MRIWQSIVATCMALSFFASQGLTEPVKLTDGTLIKVRLRQTLTSGKVKTGELVQFSVVENVVSPKGHILVEKGATASGKVTVSKRRGMLGVAGKLEFTIESVTAIDGTSIPVRGQKSASGQNNTAVTVVTTVLFFLPALFVHGRDVTVTEGTEFPAYVSGNDVVVDPAKGAKDGVPATVALPVAKFNIISSLIVNDNVIGELENLGPDVAGAEIVVFIREGEKLVGGGTATLERVILNKKTVFKVPVTGGKGDTLDVQVNAIIPTAPVFHLKVINSIVTGKKLIGEIQNDGEEAAGALLVVSFMQKDTVIGGGTTEVPQIPPGGKSSFTISIEGEAKGDPHFDIEGKDLSTAPVAVK